MFPIKKPRGGPPGDHSSNDTSQGSLLLDRAVNRALKFVKKVENRFREQPDKYQKFLDILHAYRNDQTNSITVEYVCTQFAELFQDQADLIQDFKEFLPARNGAPNDLHNLLDYTSKE